jgi:hypothetical protein
MSNLATSPFSLLEPSPDHYTPDCYLREENKILKQIIAVDDARILALRAEIAALLQMLGLRAEQVH